MFITTYHPSSSVLVTSKTTSGPGKASQKYRTRQWNGQFFFLSSDRLAQLCMKQQHLVRSSGQPLRFFTKSCKALVTT